MKDGMFVFDNVVHMFDNTAANLVPGRDIVAAGGEAFANALDRHPRYTGNLDWGHSREEIEEAGRILFEESDTDMAIAQTVPLFHYYDQGMAPAARNHALAAAYPDRVLFCGGVDPMVMGLAGAKDEMRRQVEEWGAISFKFYNAQHQAGWDCDDRALAYPLYELAQELGVGWLQFHKGVPLGLEPLKYLHPLDLDAVFRDFPDLQFSIHHVGATWVDETILVAQRHPHVSLVMVNEFVEYWARPRHVLEVMGKALFHLGPDRLLYGSEAFIFEDVQSFIEGAFDMAMPQDLMEGYAYPPITDEVRRKILGENQARILGIDLEAKKAALGLL